MSNLLQGLKEFFMEEKLSDRRIRIIEIQENFNQNKRKRESDDTSITDFPHLKKTKDGTQSLDGMSSNKELPLNVAPSQDDKIQEEHQALSNDKVLELPKEDVKNLKAISSNSEDQLDNYCASTSSQTELLHAEIPVHSIVLCLNSCYFQKMFIESGMRETNMSNVEIKVNHGEGKFLELLLKAFYDEDTLTDLSLPDLLSVMDIAARFSCTSFVELGLDLLDKKTVKTLDDCNTILQCVSRVFQTFDSNEKYKKTWDSCIKFLCEALFPLEFKFSQQEKFKKLDYRTVLSLLRSAHAFVLHENHLVTFAYQWLECNPEFQTSEIIESFLNAIRFESLTVTFLTDELTICDRIFNKWNNYPQWFINTMKYHSLSHGNRELRGLKTPCLAFRGMVAPVNNALYASKHYAYQPEGKQMISLTENRFLWHGVLLDPLLTIKENDENTWYVRMRIVKCNAFQPLEPVKQFYQRFDFYFCMLPGFVQFKTSLLKQKKFITKFIRKAEIEFRSADVSSMHAVAKIDEGFLRILEQHGLNVILFFKKNSFSWVKFDTHQVKPSKKLILLTSNKNYQQYVI